MLQMCRLLESISRRKYQKDLFTNNSNEGVIGESDALASPTSILEAGDSAKRKYVSFQLHVIYCTVM